ncbi:hypothetical protein H8356DRAFT_1337718 [Neocallimastix lanati (nom. inval.)]|nr:hypothetical protein H8356DRAFT_1337718 [Neocallimastix sp. JGI-2020a]
MTYDEICRMVIADSLTTTMELIQKLLCDLNNEKIPLEVIKNLKHKISLQLNDVFCFTASFDN